MDRDELIQLSEEGKIKYKKKFLKEADDETIEKISKEYVAKQLDETNEKLSDIIIEKFSDLLAQTEMVDDSSDLKKDLSKNKMFRSDLKNFVGSVTPYVPYIGLISGLLTVAGYVVYKKFGTENEVERSEDSEATANAKPPPEKSEAPKERKPRAPRKRKETRSSERSPKAEETRSSAGTAGNAQPPKEPE